VNKILEIKFGSHLYGTNTPESDMDFKAIYLPTAREIVLGTYKDTIATSRPKRLNERNTKDDVDIDVYSLDRFLSLLTEGQTVALDMLFAPDRNHVNMTAQGSIILLEIWRNLDKLLTRNVNTFVEYARQQAAKYGIKGSRLDSLKRVTAFLDTLPLHDKLSLHEDKIYAFVKECEQVLSLEKAPLVETILLPSNNKTVMIPHLRVNGRACPFHANVKYAKQIYEKILEEYGGRAHKAHLSGGKDWKALSHAVRVNHEALELLTTGKITFPRPERELLLKIKTEKMPYEEVAEIIEQGLVDLTVAHEKSTLRDEPDREWADNFVYSIYSEIVKNG
jgi:sulfur transfer complex TusBCD TusB component (DsrH family)